MNKNIPWVEKYRPTDFNDVIFSETNQTIFEEIINKKYFPNMILYGKPGTGKTTTVINIIKKYLQKYYTYSSELVIHLNASDDRGIDTIRTQIQSFVRSNHIFNKGLKFVILDEVDYMTKNAQQSLRYIIQTYSTNVRFCLICNYISKIDVLLRTNFIEIKFHHLPKENVIHLLTLICDNENIQISTENIEMIYHNFQYDIRSMINFIQKYIYYNKKHSIYIHTKKSIENMIYLIKTYKDIKKTLITINNECILANITHIKLYIKLFHYCLHYYIKNHTKISTMYNYKNMIKTYNPSYRYKYELFHYDYNTNKIHPLYILHNMKNIIHSNNIDQHYISHFFILSIQSFFSSFNSENDEKSLNSYPP